MRIEEGEKLSQFVREHCNVCRVQPSHSFLEFIANGLNVFVLHGNGLHNLAERSFDNPPKLPHLPIYVVSRLAKRIHVVFQLNLSLAPTTNNHISQSNLPEPDWICKLAPRTFNFDFIAVDVPIPFEFG